MNVQCQSANSKNILFCRLPGLLSLAARHARCASHALSPLIASEGRLVRDACPLSLRQGVRPGMTVVQARRLCPAVIAVPVEESDLAAFIAKRGESPGRGRPQGARNKPKQTSG